MPKEIKLSSRQIRQLREIYDSTSPWILDRIAALDIPETAIDIALEAYQGGGRTLISFMHACRIPADIRHVSDRDITCSFERLEEEGVAHVTTKPYNWFVWYGRNHWLYLNDEPLASGPSPLQCVAYFAHERSLLSEPVKYVAVAELSLQFTG